MPEPRRSPDASAQHPAGGDSRFVRLSGVDVHHQAVGEGPTVLLSHHFYGSVPTWRHVTSGLGGDHQVVAFDRPGFGLTERVPRTAWQATENPYTRAAAARIGWQLLDSLGVRDAVLVGSSAGGTNVLEMYALAPERVRGLVLLSPAITGDVGPPAAIRPLLRSPQGRRIGPHVIRRLAGEVTRERVGGSWHDPQRVTAEDLAPYRQLLQVDGFERGLWEVLTAEDPPDLRALLPSITVPTLVVGGSSDRVIASASNRRTAAAIPGARYEEIAGCGHTPQEECPEQLVALIRAFLDGLDG